MDPMCSTDLRLRTCVIDGTPDLGHGTEIIYFLPSANSFRELRPMRDNRSYYLNQATDLQHKRTNFPQQGSTI